MKTFIKVVAAVAVLLAIFLLLPKIQSFQTQDIVTKVETDTVYLSDTVYMEKLVYLDKIIDPEPDTVFVYLGDTVTRYRDTLESDSIDISYEADVVGSLKSLELGYYLKYPTSVITTPHVVTTNTVVRTGLFAGGGIRYLEDGKLDFQVGISLGNKSGLLYSYDFSVQRKEHSVSIKKLLFK